MELRHLRYLVAIADAGTFVRAAEQLRVAQPALTRQIHDLEKELGVELFDARARKATLTSAGSACVHLARHVIWDTEQAVARARLSNRGVVGRCVVASGPLPLISGLVAQFLARMSARYPGITLVVQERSSHDQWDAVERADADIGLGVCPPASYASLTWETQYVQAMDHVMIAPSHPLASRASLELAELKDLPFLALERVSTDVDVMRDTLLPDLKRRNFPVASLAPRQFPNVESLIAHLRMGQGWAIAPASFAKRLTGLVAIPITDFGAPLRTHRIWRRADTRPVTQTVLRELRRFQEDQPVQTADADSAKVDSADVATQPARHEEFVPARLDLRHLRSFRAVAKYGSLGRAAEVLEVTQPALSRQMRELEYDVGVQLLERGTRGMELTAAGESFLDAVQSVLSIVEHVPREVRRALRGSALRCVIGTVPHPYAERILTRAMADLEGRESRVRMGVRPVMTPQQAEALRAGDIDIGIGHAFPAPVRPAASRGLVVQRLFDDRICVALLAAGHALAASPVLALRDLEEVPFIWASRDFFPLFHDAVFDQFRAAGLRPRVQGEYDGLTTMWTIAARGLGWTLGWQSHREEPPPGLRAVPLQDFSMEWGGEIVYRQDESRAPVLAAIDAIIAHARDLYHSVKAADAALPGRDTSRTAIS